MEDIKSLTARIENLESILSAEKFELVSKNGKNKISFIALDNMAGVWVENEKYGAGITAMPSYGSCFAYNKEEMQNAGQFQVSISVFGDTGTIQLMRGQQIHTFSCPEETD